MQPLRSGHGPCFANPWLRAMIRSWMLGSKPTFTTTYAPVSTAGFEKRPHQEVSARLCMCSSPSTRETPVVASAGTHTAGEGGQRQGAASTGAKLQTKMAPVLKANAHSLTGKGKPGVIRPARAIKMSVLLLWFALFMESLVIGVSILRNS